MVLGDNTKRLVLIGWNDFTWDARQERIQNAVYIYRWKYGGIVCAREKV